jgi:hypothetical protein
MLTQLRRTLRRCLGFGPAKFPQGRCFVSHSYKDNVATTALTKAMQGRAKLVVFPPITVAPESMVSTELLSTIRKCDSLVHILGGESAASGWVVLERDYAVRSGLDVYSFDPNTGSIQLDRSGSMNLPVFPSYLHEDHETVVEILKIMAERYFDVSFTDDDSNGASSDIWSWRPERTLSSRLKKGGYLIAFLSKKAILSEWVKSEIKTAADLYPGRILPVLLEPMESSVPSGELPIHLYLPGGAGIDRRRIDDIIVRLYWLIERNNA